jgi:8-oxo-dGTP pyrophosphatase MutT (NUDIX family)
MDRVAKVLVYVTRHDDELLVIEHVDDDAGVQVPGGTVEPDEPLTEAAVRELREEVGIEAERVDLLGATDRPHPHRPVVHERHFFHTVVDEPRDRWRHVVEGGGEDDGLTFECYWLPVAEAQSVLGRDQEAYLDALGDPATSRSRRS